MKLGLASISMLVLIQVAQASPTLFPSSRISFGRPYCVTAPSMFLAALQHLAALLAFEGAGCFIATCNPVAGTPN
jgi:hypothetical protein